MKKLILILWLLFFLKTPVFSQEIIDTTRKTALGINPAIIEAIVDDKPVTKEVTLFNLTNFPLPIKTLKESFTPKEKLTIPQEKLKIFDASSWISLSEKDTDFILQPREVRKIKLTINKPQEAPPGGHYASLVFQPLIPQEIVSKESIFIFARVAALIFIQTKGEIIEDLSLKKINLQPLYQSTPITIEAILKNNGNTHVRPAGKVALYDEIRKKTIAHFSFLPSLILPGTEKAYPVTIDEANLFGYYSIKAELTYGTENKIIQSEKLYFYVFPYTTVSIIALVFIIIIILAIKLRLRLYKAFNILFFGEKSLRQQRQKKLNRIKIKKISLHQK